MGDKLSLHPTLCQDCAGKLQAGDWQGHVETKVCHGTEDEDSGTNEKGRRWGRW